MLIAKKDKKLMKDNKNDLISPEIIKLTEKMAKDPASTLFFPLAEEYRKCDMLDEAIILLTDGLKNHPNFLSARVSLGKIYLQKGLTPEAKSEFEKVIQSAPDNILAQKKLAMIYRDEGDREKAIESCGRLLLLNPNDEEIRKIKSELEVKADKAGRADLPLEEKRPMKPLPVIEEKSQPDKSIILKPEESVTEKAEEKEVKFDSSPIYEIKDEDIDLKEIFSGGPRIEPQAEVKDTAEENTAEEDSSLSDIIKITTDEGEKAEEMPLYEIKDEEVSLNDILVGREKAEETSILKEETSEEHLDKKRGWEDITIDKEEGAVHEEIASEALAELYIRQEHFDKAIEVLKILLDKDTLNETLRQKMEDAITLKNLMGGEVLPKGHDIPKEEPLNEEEITFSETISEALESPMTPKEKTLGVISKEGQEEETEDTRKTKKIKRLEQWLENIKRSHEE